MTPIFTTIRANALVFAMVLVGGCLGRDCATQSAGSKQTSGGERGSPEDKGKFLAAGRPANFATVRVFYATDRDAKATTDPHERYGGSRGNVTYGTCLVSIPRDHRMGELEAPAIWRLEFSEDPAHHVVLRSVDSLDQERFFGALRKKIEGSAENSALVFVHGYNTSFEDAARRTAQITYDLSFDGAAIFYSWPSRANAGEYTVDETNAEWSRPHLRQFLAGLLQMSPARNVYLIAHSMGNRVLANAVLDLEAADPSVRARIREIILAAPDIDADVFKRDIAPKLVGSGENQSHVTLYASERDFALRASKAFHGYPRAGDAASQAMVDGLETIDASEVKSDFLGHSYYGDNNSVLGDIYYLIHSHIRACDRFGLQRVQTPAGTQCTFRR